MNYWTQSETNIFVAAHRGFSGEYPENTMLAFKEAIKLGVDQIETDVRITKDNELVLIHDSTLERTTNGSGKVCDYTLSELKQLDAGRGPPNQQDHTSPNAVRGKTKVHRSPQPCCCVGTPAGRCHTHRYACPAYRPPHGEMPPDVR